MLFWWRHGMTFRQWFVNEGPMYCFVMLWMLANIFLFFHTYNFYHEPQFAYLRFIVHKGLPVARGAASVLNLNCALVLLPVCRNLVNFCRGLFESKRSIRRLFDKNILFHKWCAYVICFFASIHICAHFFNVNNLVEDGSYSRIIDRGSPMSQEEVLFTTVAGGTGIGITVPLILMVTTASEQIRRSYFELFWYTHHLFVVFYVCLCLHGSSGFIEKQVNTREYPVSDELGPCTPRNLNVDTINEGCQPWSRVETLYVDAGQALATANKCAFADVAIDDNPGAFCCPCQGVTELEVTKGGPATWMWVIGPLVLYLLERLYRYYMSKARRLSILKVVKHKDKVPVMEIQFQKVPTKAGQYIFINCPKVNGLEWHPFTLTSCPELDYISLHIRLVGDWTTKFADACGFYEDNPKSASELPEVCIDGPFGTASEDMYRYQAAVLVGAGIGVTPFASLLKEIYFRKANPQDYPNFKTKKVYFYWMCPGFDAWGWFASLLMELEEQLEAIGQSDFLDVRVYTTRGWSKDDAAKIMLQEDEAGDSIVRDEETGRSLKHKMNFGRPNWQREFTDVANNHSGDNVGVFFCGPKVLSTQLHVKCNEFTRDRAREGTRFFYNKENF
eukprot:TRINITY_DN12014_c0_g1_i5.p1 TRINITY_DN12014_c0_g1~~TRINITY_DN12014_c0_g1_i5.p1  ORF type:complete len:616 (+),score=138.37 TRINITY_DN12014_c0_g1_i5:75-1922(+)